MTNGRGVPVKRESPGKSMNFMNMIAIMKKTIRDLSESSCMNFQNFMMLCFILFVVIIVVD